VTSTPLAWKSSSEIAHNRQSVVITASVPFYAINAPRLNNRGAHLHAPRLF